MATYTDDEGNEYKGPAPAAFKKLIVPVLLAVGAIVVALFAFGML
jgi:hypothetical protein